MGVCCIDGFQRPTLTVPLGEMPATRHFVLGRKPRFLLCETGLLDARSNTLLEERFWANRVTKIGVKPLPLGMGI